MGIAMGTDMDMAMAMAMRLVGMVAPNLTVSPWEISARAAEVQHVNGNQVMFVMHMATCKSIARQLQHTHTITMAVVMKLAAARLEQSSMAVRCCSMDVVTSLAIVSK